LALNSARDRANRPDLWAGEGDVRDAALGADRLYIEAPR